MKALPLAVLFSLLTSAPSLARAADAPGVRGVAACETCHRDIAETFRTTAHFAASSAAGTETIRGPFGAGRNVLRTRVEGVYFRMERRTDGAYQVGAANGRERAERFDLVIGSGRRGQSYLYWKEDLLFQLPVSYLAALDGWVNSPGFADGAVHFERMIPPRCLECHATTVRWRTTASGPRFEREAVLGIACQKCHDEGRDHAAIRNPARFERERQLDVCALCHSGIREPRKPSFSFRPGDRLDEYLAPESNDGTHAEPDVHGNQVGLLRASRCFGAAESLTCASCHDVHRPERDVAALAERCGRCHAAGACKLSSRLGARLTQRCIDCHMPRRASRAISINTPGKPFAQAYRTHRIAVYRDAARAVLDALGER